MRIWQTALRALAEGDIDEAVDQLLISLHLLITRSNLSLRKGSASQVFRKGPRNVRRIRKNRSNFLWQRGRYY